MHCKSHRDAAVLIAVALLLASSLLLPLPAGLTRPGACSIMLLLCAILLWVTNALPLAVTTILCATVMPFFGILDLNSVFMRFTNSTFFFMLATFCLTIAISSSSIPQRVSLYLMRQAGTSSTKLLFFFAFGTAAFSAIMSNVPSCAIFCSLILSLMKESKELQDNSSLLKCLMIAVTYAAVIGGFATPAGTSANILAMNLFQEATGKEISFLQWTSVGLPVVFLMLVVCCLWLLLAFRPRPIGQETLDAVLKAQVKQEPLTSREIKILVITCAMFVLWIAGTWLPALNTTAVALLGMCLFFCPGINVLTWKQLSEEAPWDMIFLISGSGALAYGLSATGADLWLVNTVLPQVKDLSILLILLICAVITAILHILIPSGPGTIAVALPTFLQLAPGLNDHAILMLCALWSCVVLVMPVDAVTLVTYNTGTYNFRNLLKAGIPVYLFLLPITALLIYSMCGLIF